jgi:hypothetical protein
MITGWQKSRNEPTTGFLSAPQQQALLKQASAAVTKFDDAQKKIEDEKKAAEEARARTLAVSPAASAATGAAPTTATDGLWRGTLDCRTPDVGQISARPEIKVINGSGSWKPSSGANDDITNLRIAIDGQNVTAYVARMGRGNASVGLYGRIDGDSMRATGRGMDSSTCTLSLTLDAQKKIGDEKKAAEEARARAVAVAPAAPPAVTGATPTTSPDGLWRGALECRARPQAGSISDLTSRPEIKVTNGSGLWTPTSGANDGIRSLRIAINGQNMTADLTTLGNGSLTQLRFYGRIDRDTVRANGISNSYNCTLSLTRDP